MTYHLWGNRLMRPGFISHPRYWCWIKLKPYKNMFKILLIPHLPGEGLWIFTKTLLLLFSSFTSSSTSLLSSSPLPSLEAAGHARPANHSGVEHMPERMPEKKKECQTKQNRMSKYMSDKMPDRMSEYMSNGMPDRMQDRMSDRKPKTMSNRMLD